MNAPLTVDAGGTTIRLDLPTPSPVRLTIHDVTGRLVRSLDEGALGVGVHSIFWDGRDDGGRRAARGIYLARVSAASGTRTARFLIWR